MTAKSPSDRGLKELWPGISTVLFDVEGTLVDAVPLTLQCWQETLRDFGVKVSLSVLQCLSGMDGKDMLLRLLPDASSKERKTIIEQQGQRFQHLYLPKVKALAGARELLRAIRLSGRKVGCATDCSRAELKRYLRVAGVTRYVHGAGCESEAKRGKPHADLIHLAVRKLRSTPSATLMVGDTPSDAEAACKTGVLAIRVLTGGFRRCDLEAAGCRQVFKDLRSVQAFIWDEEAW